MDFELDPELERIQKLARELAADFAKRAAQHDQESTAPDENYAKLKEAGFYGLVAPKQYGGLGAGVLGWVIAAEELAQGCPSMAVSFNMHVATLATYLMKDNFAESYKQRLANEIVRQGGLEDCRKAPGTHNRIVSQNGNAYEEGLSEAWNPIRTLLA
jgi:alkylation response protein AidB-like acyl-CoA dehydrogenase